ncbi:predicted protein [Brucella sp. 83/13]|nr:predicted protein [Brucella sp. 83/13]
MPVWAHELTHFPLPSGESFYHLFSRSSDLAPAFASPGCWCRVNVAVCKNGSKYLNLLYLLIWCLMRSLIRVGVERQIQPAGGNSLPFPVLARQHGPQQQSVCVQLATVSTDASGYKDMWSILPISRHKGAAPVRERQMS